ncbi:MAG TPA: hypothetical protein VKX28_13170 [Xanthobacteraceae bacterium]|nr:hypothetical protein [Xanthobacteraceae bacterium]
MRPLLAGAAGIGVGVMALALTHCTPDTGYVQIKVMPGFIVPPLVLGTTRIDMSRSDGTVLRERVGPATLAYERYGERVPFCQFAIRKDRIVTIAVSAFGRDPRCKVEG